MTPTRQPIRQRSAWRPSDFPSKEVFSFALSEAHFAAFDQLLKAHHASGLAIEEMTPQVAALGSIADDIAIWQNEVFNGRGFLLLKDFPLERYSADDITTIYWALGRHFGRAVSQSPLGDRIGHVVDIGGKDRRERAYRNSRELTLHTDRCDILGMLCLHKAASGGLSGYSSAHTIYNDMLATKPELLEPLFEGFHYHRFGEQLPGDPAVTPFKVPIFSEEHGQLSVAFLRAYIEMGATELGTPLREEQVAALDYFEEVARNPEVKLTFMLEPGEAIFFNNCVLLHNRTSFDDAPEPEQRRHLLRLWLMLDGARPLAPAIHAYKGTTGIVGRAGGTTYYTGQATPEPVDVQRIQTS